MAKATTAGKQCSHCGAKFGAHNSLARHLTKNGNEECREFYNRRCEPEFLRGDDGS